MGAVPCFNVNWQVTFYDKGANISKPISSKCGGVITPLKMSKRAGIFENSNKKLVKKCLVRWHVVRVISVTSIKNNYNNKTNKFKSYYAFCLSTLVQCCE